MTLHALGFCLLAALAAEAPGENFVVRVERNLYQGAEAEALEKTLHSGGNVKLDQLECAHTQSLELRVRRDAEFFGRAKVGRQTLAVRGELKTGTEPGLFVLDISAEVSKFRGMTALQPDGRETEIRDRTSANTQIAVPIGKRLFLGGALCRQNPAAATFELITVVVERADDEE